MTRTCLVLVVLVVTVAVLSDARPRNCEQKERSLADLDLVEDALRKAKDRLPNCEDEKDSSNSSECSRKDKSLGLIDVALNLVADAKKNFPVCPEVTTEEPPTNATTPLTKVTTEELPTNVTTEDLLPMDCQELLAAGNLSSGVYTVWPRIRMIRGKAVPLQVRCDMDTDGGGWTVIQRRGNFSQQENFNRNWKDYKNGFGNLDRDFWLGNDHIFTLSNQGAYSLRIDMTAVDGWSAYAVFHNFSIEDEKSNYTLHVGPYNETSTAGDSMTMSNGQMFTTKDRTNDHCAGLWKGGFWYDNCGRCNPNGLYKPGVNDGSSVFYYTFRNTVGLFFMEMKLKRL